jgi:hypothetical protein
MKYSLFTLALVAIFFSASFAHAEEVAAGDVCVTGLSSAIMAIAVGIVPACSVLANFVGKDTILGKLINFFAINFTVKKVPKG